MTTAQLQQGFMEPVHDAQQAFRTLMKVMSEPGLLRTLNQADGIAPMSPAAVTTLLALLDQTTSLWLSRSLSTAAVCSNLSFHSGAPLIDDPAIADFAIAVPAELPELDRLRIGEPDYPDRSCTLLVQVEQLATEKNTAASTGLRLSGPGIPGQRTLYLSDPGASLLRYLVARPDPFPQGIDLILLAGDCVTAIPRTTQVEVI
ncbi:phosphonate C-P lyase system protein PhnH [Marinobacterium sediminicola]|uniref:Methylphosphonate degradation complex, subunit phnH n=1 Tax=Marinobacterium sediminicola TaxID=518898 RepID=A0ABY1RYH7_9GAMM|nr:phosphonate C-P lyase system protein PhnH [Marinobacterium sediminicola]ULG68110.1 phosphonate C-P lyase system protein PhnH [Marinobacterium sediminicola]SMR73377.1 methylphosphonate degradation complex, subunit phnH [Marinobacterium sediminicola]